VCCMRSGRDRDNAERLLSVKVPVYVEQRGYLQHAYDGPDMASTAD